MRRTRNLLLIFGSISNLGSCGIASYNAYMGTDITKSAAWVCFAIISAITAIKIMTITKREEDRP